MNGEVCCFGKESDSEFNTSLTALKLPCVASSWVLNPSHTIKRTCVWQKTNLQNMDLMKTGIHKTGFEKTPNQSHVLVKPGIR
jgi:hypothetical protein